MLHVLNLDANKNRVVFSENVHDMKCFCMLIWTVNV